jgi:hypothetical protein
MFLVEDMERRSRRFPLQQERFRGSARAPTPRWLRCTHRLPSREIRQTLMRVRLCSDACVWKSASAWHNSPTWFGMLNQSLMTVLVPRCHWAQVTKKSGMHRHGGLGIKQQSRRMGDRRLCLIAPRRCFAVAERKRTVRASRTGGEKITFASSRCASQGRPSPTEEG